MKNWREVEEEPHLGYRTATQHMEGFGKAAGGPAHDVMRS